MSALQKLGKLPARHDSRTLRLSKYIGALPPAPPARNWGAKLPLDWGMMANDRLGNCTCAGIGHAVQTWSANDSDTTIVLPDSVIVGEYSAITGYDGTPDTDNGAIELDVLKHAKTAGFGGLVILDAFMAVNPRNHEHIKQTINLFGGAYIGVGLPVSAQDQDVWDVPAGGLSGDGAVGSWGGHALWVPSYADQGDDADGLICVTWGKPKRLTWAFLREYCDEAYALLSPLWTGADLLAPNGFALDLLQADLAAL